MPQNPEAVYESLHSLHDAMERLSAVNVREESAAEAHEETDVEAIAA